MDMDEDLFNISVRKFLKQFGVTAQREIEKAVAAAVERGALSGTDVLPVHATLTIPGVLEAHRVDGELTLRHAPGGGEEG